MVTLTLGSPLRFSAGIGRTRNAPLAQSAEQLTLNQWVLGSSPRGCTTKSPFYRYYAEEGAFVCTADLWITALRALFVQSGLPMNPTIATVENAVAGPVSVLVQVPASVDNHVDMMSDDSAVNGTALRSLRQMLSEVSAK